MQWPRHSPARLVKPCQGEDASIKAALLRAGSGTAEVG